MTCAPHACLYIRYRKPCSSLSVAYPIQTQLLILGSHMQRSWVRRRQTRLPEIQACTLLCLQSQSITPSQSASNDQQTFQAVPAGISQPCMPSAEGDACPAGAACLRAEPKHPSPPAYIFSGRHAISLLVPRSTELCHAGSSNVQFQRLDISDPASVDEFGKWAKAELRTVSVLVDNAGESFFL